jgi:hypothetical protein
MKNYNFLIAIILMLAACTPSASEIQTDVAQTQAPNSISTLTPFATQTAALDITPDSLPILTTSPNSILTSSIFSVPIPDAFVSHIAMDDKFIYWTTESEGNLFRYPLTSSKNTDITIIARTQFNQGILSTYPVQSLFRVGTWLIFDDRQIPKWTLRALNVVDKTEQKLTQIQDANILFSFSSDGEWVVWITGDLSGETIITAQNLQTKQLQELARSVSAQNGWEQVVVSAGQAIATQRGIAGRSLFLFELKSGQSRKLLSDTIGSDMDGLTFDGNWIAWKTGTNYQGPTALYNLQTAKTELLPDWGIRPLLVGRWLTWADAPEQPLYVIDLESRQSYIVAEAQSGDELTSVAIHSDIIAWCRLHSNLPDNSKVDSRVEWRTLP